MRTSHKTAGIVATIGIDIGKNTFHLVGLHPLERTVQRRLLVAVKDRIRMDPGGLSTTARPGARFVGQVSG